MYAIFIAISALAVIISFKFLIGEKERVKTLFRIYKAAKVRFSEKSERELLEIVVGEHILPNKGIRLRNSGITGKQYIDEVFNSRSLDIKELIEHIITLEFPKKYKPSKINLEEMYDQVKNEKVSPREELRLIIEKYQRKFLT